MSKMGRISATDKVVAVEKYLNGKESHASIAKEYDVAVAHFKSGCLTIKLWGKTDYINVQKTDTIRNR